MIEYKNVALRYDEKLVLKDVNLSINDGEFMVLVGPSGSGKTTMLKMINQLIEPTDGNIYLNEWANRIAKRPAVQKGVEAEYKSIK